MKIFAWILGVAALIALGVGEWHLARMIRTEMADTRAHTRRGPPYEITISGDALRKKIAEDLTTLNAARMARVDEGLGNAVVVEGVTYERNGGVVHAQGKVRDLGEGRRLLAVMDAYDQDMNYLTSAAAPLQSVRSNTISFSVAMPDRMDLSTLSFRVLLEADRSEILSLTEGDLQKRKADIEDRAILLPDDRVMAIDVQEVEERLRHLGYVSSAADVAVGEPAMRVVLARFRRDHGLAASRGIDIASLLALRIVTPGFRPRYSATL